MTVPIQSLRDSQDASAKVYCLTRVERIQSGVLHRRAHDALLASPPRKRHTGSVKRKTTIAGAAFAVLVPGLLWLLLPVVNHAGRSVAFLGDSLTQGWAFPRENFGIYGQTTAQMLARFPQQIPGHSTVVILGGTNDTLLGIDPAITVANLDRMLTLAHSDGIAPVLAEIPPIYRDRGKYLPTVDRLNAAIVQLARKRHVPLVDFHAALLNHQSSYSDGTHLKRRGYLRMEIALLQTENIF